MIRHSFFAAAPFIACIYAAAAEPPPSPLVVLSQQAPNAMAWVLAPLDRAVPEDIRQNLMFLREDLLDEGTGKTENALDAYRFGHQLCASMLAALDERDKALVRAGVTNAQANANVVITSQALEARRSGGSRTVTTTNGLTGTSTTVVREFSSWPQYFREGDQREELRNQANSKIALANERPKVEWADRVAQLRTQLDGLYAQFRSALRKEPGLLQSKTVVAIPSPASSSGTNSSSAPSMPATPPKTSGPARADFTNSLGMKFVAVPDTNILMCIHETRYKDYAAYAAESPDVNGAWKNTPWEDNHPVGAVNWEDAHKFCEWLSKKEGRNYRLPTDREWSCAAGIGREEKWTKNTTPESLTHQVQAYPWGGQFPPSNKDGAGNFADTTCKEQNPKQNIIASYTDGFATSAPTMSFKPNKLGLYDMGGNVCEWVEDWYNEEKSDRVLRGTCWRDYNPTIMLSSYRFHYAPTTRTASYGFRCVLENAK